MRRVVVETPFAGDVARNLRYLRACMRDCLKRDEAPYASHAIYTQPGVLDDGDAEERTNGIQAGFQWRGVADATVVYTDLGMSGGMKAGIGAASAMIVNGAQHKVEYRTLGADWEQRARECEASFKTQWPSFSSTADSQPTVDEAIDLLGRFCDVIGFKIDDSKFTRDDFLMECLKRIALDSAIVDCTVKV